MADTSQDWSAVERDPATVEAPSRAASEAEWGEVETDPTGIASRSSTDPERAGALGRGVIGGAVEGVGLVGGAIAGGQLGALTGPGAPIAIPTGVVLGGLAGWYAGHKARQGLSKVKAPLTDTPLTFEKVEDLPPDQRSFGIAGEVVGSGLAFTGGTIGLAKSGARMAPTTVGNFFNSILDTAATRTAAFTAVEASSLIGSGIGGGLAEEIAPGNLPARITGEIVGGFFNFPRIATATARAATNKVRQLAAGFSDSAAQTRAAQVLMDALAEAGEDPGEFIALLKAADLPGVRTTVAQKTGSHALATLEKDLIEQSREFGNIAHQQSRESMEALANIIETLRGTGDPMALRMAAEIRSDAFRTMLQSRVNRAMDEAIDAASKITDDSPDVMSQLSTTARNILDTSLKQARAAEDELWSAVRRDALAAPTNVLARHAELRGSMLPREKLPDVIEGTIHDLQQAGELLAKVEAGAFPPKGMTGKALEEARARITEAESMFTTGFLIKLRKRALSLARDAADRPGGGNEARQYGEIAAAVLDDLNAGFKGLGEVDEAYDVARTFSHELNDVFTRTFAGAAQRTGQGGADRLPPELLLRRAMASGREAAALRLSELEEATRFLPLRDLGGPEAAANVDLMLDAQQRLLRLAAAESVDPLTNVTNAKALQRFIDKNAELMNRFPEIKADLQRAVDSGTGLKAVERLRTNATSIVQKKAVFARIIGVESPSEAVAGVINRSTNPAHQLSEFARFARNHGEEAREGFKAAVWDYAMQKAARHGNYLEGLIQALQNPIRPGLPSVLGVLQKEGTLTGRDVEVLGQVMTRLRTMAEAMATPGTGELVGGTTDAFTDFALRVVGAQAGSKALEIARGVTGATGSGAGPSIVVAGRGSAFARAVFDRLPHAKTREALSAILSDPQFAAKVLEKPATQAGKIQQARQIHAYLVAAGLTAPLDSNEETEIKREGRTGLLRGGEDAAPDTPGQGAVLETNVEVTELPGDLGFEPRPTTTDNTATEQHIKGFEKLRLKSYKDAGDKSVGYGFHLARPDAKKLIEGVGADYDKVRSGKQSLTQKQADELFEHAYDEAVKTVKKVIPDVDNLSPDRQTALVDMAYNMGESRFRQFKKLIAASKSGDWTAAAQEILKSDYAKQLPDRAKRNAGLISPTQLKAE